MHELVVTSGMSVRYPLGADGPSRASGASWKSAPSALPACGPVATWQSSPVSQTSPMGSVPAERGRTRGADRDNPTRGWQRSAQCGRVAQLEGED